MPNGDMNHTGKYNHDHMVHLNLSLSSIIRRVPKSDDHYVFQCVR